MPAIYKANVVIIAPRVPDEAFYPLPRSQYRSVNDSSQRRGGNTRSRRHDVGCTYPYTPYLTKMIRCLQGVGGPHPPSAQPFTGIFATASEPVLILEAGSVTHVYEFGRYLWGRMCIGCGVVVDRRVGQPQFRGLYQEFGIISSGSCDAERSCALKLEGERGDVGKNEQSVKRGLNGEPVKTYWTES